MFKTRCGSTFVLAAGMATLLTLTAQVSPALSQPPPAQDKVVNPAIAADGESKVPTNVILLVRTDGQLVIDARLQTTGEFTSALEKIKRDGKSLAIRAEHEVPKDQLCSLLADCRRVGIEPAEFAEPDGQPINHYAGTVVDPDGKPIAGARILLSYFRETPRAPDAPPEAVTDASGRFEFIRRMSDFDDAEHGLSPSSATLVAIKEGFGFAIGSSSYCLTTNHPPDTEQRREMARKRYLGTPTVLRLVADDLPIHGRVLDTEGKPVVHAKIEGVNSHFQMNESLDAWETACSEQDANFYSVRTLAPHLLNENYRHGFQTGVVPIVHTDDDGWFTLRGVGRERIEEIFISGLNIETVRIHARTREGQTIRLSINYRGEPAPSFDLYYPREFTVVVGQSQAVIGLVTDSVTGQALPGISIRGQSLASQPNWSIYSPASHIRSITDQDGRYHLSGLPIGTNTFIVSPPPGSPYLRSNVEVTTAQNAGPLLRDIPLTSGVLVNGHVIDATTGKPVRGTVEYIPYSKNPLAKSTPGMTRPHRNSAEYQTDSQGRFAIPVLAGTGVLAFKAKMHQMYPRSPEAEGQETQMLIEIYEKFNGPGMMIVSPRDYHFVLPLDIAPDAKEATQSIVLHSGVTLTGRVISADGTPLSKYYLFGYTSPSGWNPSQTAEFKVDGYFAKFGRRLMAWDPATNQVGMLELTGEVQSPLEIRLQPGGKIVGRVVDDQGVPVEGAVLTNRGIGIAELGRANEAGSKRGVLIDSVDSRPIRTDQDGRFELPGVLPGQTYVGTVRIPMIIRDRKSLMGYPLFDDVTVQPGETKDLGDLKPRKSQPPPIPSKEKNDASKPKDKP